MRKHLTGIAFFILVVISLVVYFYPEPLESDDRMVAKFEKHRGDLEGLVVMIGRDPSVQTVHRDYVLLGGYRRWDRADQSEFTQERWEEYKLAFNRLKELRINGIERKDGRFIFGASSAAFKEIDSSYESIYVGKGFVYSSRPLKPIVDSLDNTGFAITDTHYRSMGDGWYIYRDSGISKPE